MKALIDGVWHADVADTPMLRARRVDDNRLYFRNWVTKMGKPGPSGAGGFAAEPGRYHLYVSYACPWAHRTILYRVIKGLEEIVSMSVLEPRWGGPEGWRFAERENPTWGATRDHATGARFLYELYQRSAPKITAKVTVPVLWDKKTERIVSNESGEIIRMFDEAFDSAGASGPRLRPDDLAAEIDATNVQILDHVCMGVYKAGFANDQAGYERAVIALFHTLDDLEARLGVQPFLLGPRITEADWHLFATLVRFDAVYYGALRCNLKRLADYPNLSAYTRRLYHQTGVAETVRLDHIKRHYYDNLGGLVNHSIVPIGPAIDFSADPADA